jgi:hypothetical protein
MCRTFDRAEAERNFSDLQQNPYPGRGFIVGVDESGEFMVQVYWIMGRGEKSRNRVFSVEGGRLFTEAADPSKMSDEDTKLIIYNAMREVSRGAESGLSSFYVVSNGDQTDTVFDRLVPMVHPYFEYLCSCLSDREYEPDGPNFTPRITAVTHLGLRTEILIHRRSQWGESCDRLHYVYPDIANGFGFCVTTYSGDGNPLPPFRGEPLLMPLSDDGDAIMDTYWQSLSEANRVSLAVKAICRRTGKSQIRIINKYKKVA